MPIQIPIDREKIAAFCRKHEVREFALFGSVLREDFGPDSDVDVMVDFAPDAKATLFDMARMVMELETLFGRSVDLITRSGIERSDNTYRRQHILEHHEILHAA